MAHQYHPRTVKSSSSSPHHHHRVYRSFILLLLVLSAAISILRLASSSASPRLVESSTTDRRNDSALLFDTRLASSNKNHLQVEKPQQQSCSSLIDGKLAGENISGSGGGSVLCCDRSHYRTDVCYMRGDVRTSPRSSSVLLYGSDGTAAAETVRPYTRKWEAAVMATIEEVRLQPVQGGGGGGRCEVRHGVPGVLFSTGGYTGNVYHEFNDGVIPLYVTAERFGGEVVLVVAEYHAWWEARYGEAVRRLSRYEVVDFSRDRRVHCFPEMIVGLRIHGELSIDPQLMPNGRGIQDFQSLLVHAFAVNEPTTPRPATVAPSPKRERRPKLAIFVRNKSRVLQNLRQVVKACERIGFDVQILNPRRTTPLSEIGAALGSADAMLAVHGAAMTHLLFLPPGAVLVQIVPLGLDWAADAYYGEPARRLGLEYLAYKVAPRESSLYGEYDRRDPVLADPDAITSKGWSETKRVYLDRQNVRVNLRRFSSLMREAHTHILTRKGGTKNRNLVGLK